MNILRRAIRRCRHEWAWRVRHRELIAQLRARPRRLVIGASGVFEPGWVATDAHELNLLDPDSWTRYVEPGSVDAILAEHVWEHLTLDEGRVAARTCQRYLTPDGYLRVAVPDGYFPDAAFQEYIKIGGEAGGGVIGGHLVVYTYRQLAEIFEQAGLDVTLLEYHDEAGIPHCAEWDPAQGKIHRSKRFDPRGPISIILDARKRSASFNANV